MLENLVKEYQTVLEKANLYNGDIDGQAGPLTAMAALSYHCPNGIYYPKWMRFAIGELGVSELYGPDRNNPRIIHYHSYTGLKANTDEIAWCASFVNCCLVEGGGISGDNSASARDFESWGHACGINTYGAVMTVKTNTGSKRHVFFNAGFYKDLVLGLGGNQGNMVSIMNRNKSDIIASRYKI